jgi:hypothetical protein
MVSYCERWSESAQKCCFKYARILTDANRRSRGRGQNSVEAQITSALIGFGGTVAALVVKDVAMAWIQVRRKRNEEIADREAEAADERLDTVRIYAHPLLEATRSLRIKLDETTDKGSRRYYLASTPATDFVQYKRISTLYRLAALLGWIRAFRRERSYLDPDNAGTDAPTVAIKEIESALADGQDVERQRLRELFGLWRIPENPPPSEDAIAPFAEIRRFAGSQVDPVAADFVHERRRVGIAGTTHRGTSRQCARHVSLG